MLCDGLLSHVPGHKTAIGVSNHCNGGCIPKKLEKQEWRCETIIVAEAMCWPCFWFSGASVCDKQSWQRLPGLDNGTVSLANSSHTSSTSGVDCLLETIQQEFESILFEVFILCRVKLDSWLKMAGFVWEDGKKVETGDYIWKGVVINPKHAESMSGSHQVSEADSGANTSSQLHMTLSAPKQLEKS